MSSPTRQQSHADEIRRLEAEGKNPREIADALSITVQSIRNVLAGFTENGQPIDVGHTAMEAIRMADSLDQEWPLGELLNAFRFPTRVRKALESRFEWNDIALMSVRQLFDTFVSDETFTKPGVVICPFLSFRNGGVDGFWLAIDRISNLDLGPAVSRVWRAKLDRLRKGQRIRGTGSHTWTKPMRSRIPD